MTTSKSAPAAATSPLAANAATTPNQPTKAAPETELKKEMAQKRAASKKAAPTPEPTTTPQTDDDEIIVRTAPKAVSIRVGLTSAQVAARAQKAAEQEEARKAAAAAQAAKMERLKDHLRMMEMLLEKGERTLLDPTRKNYAGKCCVDRVSPVGELVLVFHGTAYPVCANTAEAGKIVFAGIPHKERTYRARRLMVALNLEEAKAAQEQDAKYEAKLQAKFEEEVLEKFQAGLSGKPGINGETPILAPACEYVNFNSEEMKSTYLKLLRGEFTQEEDGEIIPVPAPKDECNPKHPITHFAVVGVNLIPGDEELKVVVFTKKTAEALKSLMEQGKVEIPDGIHGFFKDDEKREEITLVGLMKSQMNLITHRPEDKE